jgi:hypothetical protein
MVATTLPQQDRKFSLKGLFQTTDDLIRQWTKTYHATLSQHRLLFYESLHKNTLDMELNILQFDVSLFPSPPCESDSFLKQCPIMLCPKTQHEGEPEENRTCYYLFCETNISKEEWFLALRNATVVFGDRDKPVSLLETESEEEKGKKATLKQNLVDFAHDWASLTGHISNIENSELKCLNAIFCRIFLGLYQKEATKNFFVQKILKKAHKVNKPSILGDILVREFNLGACQPLFSNSRLLHISDDGGLEAEIDVVYHGGVKVVIETEAMLPYLATLMNKNFKLPLVLSIYLKRLSGRLRIRVRQHPTNRLWLGFIEPPEMKVAVDPIVSDKRIKFNIILQAIERKIQEAMMEAAVLPNMDDYPFFTEEDPSTKPSKEDLFIFQDDPKGPEESIQSDQAASKTSMSPPSKPSKKDNLPSPLSIPGTNFSKPPTIATVASPSESNLPSAPIEQLSFINRWSNTGFGQFTKAKAHAETLPSRLPDFLKERLAVRTTSAHETSTSTSDNAAKRTASFESANERDKDKKESPPTWTSIFNKIDKKITPSQSQELEVEAQSIQGNVPSKPFLSFSLDKVLSAKSRSKTNDFADPDVVAVDPDAIRLESIDNLNEDQLPSSSNPKLTIRPLSKSHISRKSESSASLLLPFSSATNSLDDLRKKENEDERGPRRRQSFSSRNSSTPSLLSSSTLHNQKSTGLASDTPGLTNEGIQETVNGTRSFTSTAQASTNTPVSPVTPSSTAVTAMTSITQNVHAAFSLLTKKHASISSNGSLGSLGTVTSRKGRTDCEPNTSSGSMEKFEKSST